MNRAIALTTVSTLALGGLVLAAPAASAKDGDIKMRGACTAPSSSHWAVKVKPKKGALRTDFWVKTDAVGQSWSFTLTRAGDPGRRRASKSTIASDDDDRSRGIARISLRDRGEDDGFDDSDDDSDDYGFDDSDDDSDDDSRDDDSDERQSTTTRATTTPTTTRGRRLRRRPAA